MSFVSVSCTSHAFDLCCRILSDFLFIYVHGRRLMIVAVTTCLVHFRMDPFLCHINEHVPFFLVKPAVSNDGFYKYTNARRFKAVFTATRIYPYLCPIASLRWYRSLPHPKAPIAPSKNAPPIHKVSRSWVFVHYIRNLRKGRLFRDTYPRTFPKRAQVW